MSESYLRASDADRDRVASELRDHAVAGRLDTDELDERVGRAYAAKTRGDLEALLWDLPRDRRTWPPPARAQRSPARSSPAAVALRGLWWTTMALVALAVVAIVFVAVVTGWFIAVCFAICCAMRKHQARRRGSLPATWPRPQGPVRI